MKHAIQHIHFVEDHLAPTKTPVAGRELGA